MLLKIFTNMPGTISIEIQDVGTETETHVWLAGVAESLLGYTQDEWLAQSSLKLMLAEGSYAQLMEIVTDDLKERFAPRHAELELVPKEGHCDDGAQVWCLVDKTSRMLPNGNLLLVLHVRTVQYCMVRACIQ